jgi:hypothetical protein
MICRYLVEKAFVVFNKKDEFGPAKVIANSARLRSVGHKHAVEDKSILTINKQQYQNYTDDFENYLSGNVNKID